MVTKASDTTKKYGAKQGVIAYRLVMYKIPSLILGPPPPLPPFLIACCTVKLLIKVPLQWASSGAAKPLYFLLSNEGFFYYFSFSEHNHTPSGKKTMTGVQKVTAFQVQSSGCRWQAISSITDSWAGPLEPETSRCMVSKQQGHKLWLRETY